MAQKQFKIGLSNTDKQNMAQDVYERVLALTFNEYDTTTEYEVGDFVVYNDQLYKCISATSGAWDSSKWQLATLNDLVDDIENAVAFVNDKANVDGNYPTMTVGAADNLTPYDEDSGVDQEQPFLLQGTGCGNGEQQVDTGALGLLKEKQGNTVVVNQKLITTAGSFENNGITFVKTFDANGNLKVTANGTATGLAYANLGNERQDLKGHKVLLRGCPAGGSSDTYYIKDGYGNQHDTGNGVIVTAGDDFVLQIIINNGVTVTDLVFEPIVIDLTQWFGSNDNIPADLLAHPENFFRYYQGSLAYNEGELVNANGRYLKTIGMNQWDEEWELGNIDPSTGAKINANDVIRSKNYIRVIPNTTYYFKSSGGIFVYEYDENYNFVNAIGGVTNTTRITTQRTKYLLFRCPSLYGTTYNNDISINLYYEDESRCLTYEPYEELTNIDTGTEVLRSAGSVKDSKAPDGTITRRVGSVDLGTLSWHYDSNNGYFIAEVSGIKQISSPTLLSNISCNKYMTVKQTEWNLYDKVITLLQTSNVILIHDTSLNGDTTAINGTLYYELATPTTEQGTPYSENVAIDDFGSMDFGGTNGVPQGASIFYPVDYKAFIDSLYNTLDGDATDVVKESELDSKLATLGYVKLTSVSGYDATKTQVLKNVEGTLTWVTEE